MGKKNEQLIRKHFDMSASSDMIRNLDERTFDALSFDIEKASKEHHRSKYKVDRPPSEGASHLYRRAKA